MATNDQALRVERASDTIVLIGEIDAHTAGQVRDTVLLVPEDADVRLDMSQVSFIDSSGLRVILEANQAIERNGRRLVLIAPSRPVTRVIEVAGLVSHLHIETDCHVESSLDPAG